MHRRTFDMLLPIAYAIAVLVVVMFGHGVAVGAVAAIGAMLLAAYYAGIRRNRPR
jgi:Flp pilus assembly protein TadB